MDRVELKYNPYTKEAKVIVNRKIIENIVPKGQELSIWREKIYSDLVGYLNSDNFDIFFTGIERDFEIMEDTLNKLKNTEKFSKINLKKESITQVRKISEVKELFKKMQKEAPFPQLRSEDLKKKFDKIFNNYFEIAVVATMSSGKSTLINAMLGQNLLPARNKGTTAAITRIFDNKNKKYFEGKSYDEDGNFLDDGNPLTLAKMKEWNGMEDENENKNEKKAANIEIFGNIPNIDANELKLCLIDTPGPNNSQESEHKAVTYRLLQNKESKPMILYIMNVTTPGANDDSILLKDIADEINKNGDKQSSDRFLFVLNKFDAIDSENETVDSVIKDATEYLKKHGIENPRIFPCVSQLAKVIRQKQNNDPTITKKERIKLNGEVEWQINEVELHFSDYADFLSPSTKEKIEEKIKQAKENEDSYQEALYYTGIPSVEMAINEYLSKYAVPQKIAEGVDTFLKKIEEFNLEAKANTELKDNKEKLEKLNKTLKNIIEILEKGDKGEELKKNINNISMKQENLIKLTEKRGEFLGNMAKKINELPEELRKIEAEREIKKLNDFILIKSSKFKILIENDVKKFFSEKSKQYVDEYNNYLKDLVGNISIDIPIEIFGTDVIIDENDILEDCIEKYSETREVKVGSHLEKNPEYWTLITWLTNIFRDIEIPEYIKKDDFENQDFVKVKELVEKEIVPNIVKFLEDSDAVVKNKVSEFEDYFKNKFIERFNELEQIIKEKPKEKQSTLVDQEKTNKLIQESEKNLEWIESFRIGLENILKA